MQKLEKILEEIEKLRMTYSFQSERGQRLSRNNNMIIDAVEKIIRKHMNDGWIPVAERLPEVGKRVLATYRKNRGEYDVAQDQLIKEFWCGKEEISWDSGLDSDIIAWRPLPEPYRTERSDGE